MRNLAFGAVSTLAVVLAACGSQSPSPSPQPATATESDAIINGTLDGTAHPSVVSVITDMGSQGFGACSGTVVSIQGTTAYILTAGHCVYETQSGPAAPPTDVILGNDYSCFIYGNCSSGVHFPVSGWTKAAGWTGNVSDSSSYGNDFGMVKFENPPTSIAVSPVLPPDQAGSLQVGSSTVAVGFGKTSDNNNSNTRRYKVTMTADQVDSYYLVHHQSTQNKGTCQGDSGGPHFLNVNGTDYVAAVTSFGTSNSCVQSDGYNGRPSRTAIYNFITGYINGSTGTGGAAGSSGTGGSAGTGGGTAVDCNTCVSDAQSGACSSQIQACGANSDCVDLVNNCLNNATTAAEQQTCYDQHPAGAAILNDFFTCVCNTACVTECATECGNGTGGAAGSAGTAGTAGSAGSAGGTAGTTGGTAGNAGAAGSGTAGAGGTGIAGSNTGATAGTDGTGATDAGGSGGTGGSSSKPKTNASSTNSDGSCSVSSTRSSNNPIAIVVSALAGVVLLRRRRTSHH